MRVSDFFLLTLDALASAQKQLRTAGVELDLTAQPVEIEVQGSCRVRLGDDEFDFVVDDARETNDGKR